MNTRHLPLILLLAGLLVLNVACSDDDDPAVTGTAPPTYDDPVLEAMATESAVVAQGLIDMFPTWAQGIPGLKDKSDPEWDPTCSCWRWFINEMDEQNPGFTWSRNWYFALTYLKEEVPQMDFEGADQIQVVINYSYNTYRQQDELNYSNTSFTFELTLTSTEFTAESGFVAGQGNGNFNAYFSENGEYSQINENYSLFLAMTIPFDGGCPIGSFETDTEYTSFSVGFDGGSTAYWDYVYGPGQFKEGTLTFDCVGQELETK